MINQDTSKEEIDAWKTIAYRMGTTMDIWNVSNYGGFSFSYIPSNADCEFNKLLKNKVVIFLNNNFLNIKNKTTCATDLLGEGETFEAANLYKIASYVVGPQANFNFGNNIFPLSGFVEDIEVNDIKSLYKKLDLDK